MSTEAHGVVHQVEHSIVSSVSFCVTYTVGVPQVRSLTETFRGTLSVACVDHDVYVICFH